MGGTLTASRSKAAVRISLGVLQLADFVISRLSHTGTRCGCPAKSNQDLGPLEVESFDIWSLGCVVLELICWLALAGSDTEGNPDDTFQKARHLDQKNRSLQGTIQNTFYHAVRGDDETKFEANPKVKEVWYSSFSNI